MADVSGAEFAFGKEAAPVFPLALTPMEKYFLWDDRHEQPLTPIAELRFATPLDRVALERAIGDVIANNPLLNSIVIGPDHDLRWSLLQEPARLRCPAVEPPLIDGRLRPFDLRREPGCRFWYEVHGEGSRLLWQLHHCACDGIAMRAVLIDILLHFAMATPGADCGRIAEALCCQRFEDSELARRSDFSHLPPAKRGLGLWQRVKNARYFHFQPPRPLLSPPKNAVAMHVGASDAHDAQPLCHLAFSRQFSEQVQQKCQTSKCGLNEISLALLFRACAAWNRQLGDHGRRSRLRLMMPYDLRGRRDLRMSAANRLSFAFLGRTYQQCDDFEELVRSLGEELTAMKDTHLYLDFLNALTLGTKWPKFMRWALRRSDSMATAVITYVGDVSRGMNRIFPRNEDTFIIGNAELTAILAAPPVRRNTNVALGLCINWGQIVISASWNRAALTSVDCQKFLELYKSGWQHWCDDKE